VRDFVRGAGHNEIGMQGVELTGVGVDGDGDGVVNELGFGDISAMAAYMQTQARPQTKIELNTLGLLDPPLTTAEIAAIGRGQTVFTQVGCATCHVAQLVLNNPVMTEPSQSATHRDATFPSGVSPVSVGVDPANPIRANLITDVPDNRIAFANGDLLGGLERNRAAGAPAGSAIVRAFTDLKRHDMGPDLAEPTGVNDDGVLNSIWMTRGLWGVGSTAPYMHDGRATTLMSAIAEHGGEGATARQNVRNLPVGSQRDLIAFLGNLVIGEFNSPAAPPPPPPPTITVTASVATQTDWGAGFCQVLTVTNTGTTTANTWSVVVNFGATTVTQMWNGNRTASTGTATVSSVASWQALAPGQSTNQTGWCANRNVPNSGVLGQVVSATGN
jgi:hypothetical protein